MKIEVFLNELSEALELEDENLRLETNLNDLEEYDSLSILSIIALIDEKFGKKLTSVEFNSITTVQSLIDLIGVEKIEQ